MSAKKRILFVCIHNSARSQMAEAFLNHFAGDRFFAESAGLEPGRLNSLVVQIMAEVGIDISGNQTKSITEMISKGARYDYVITVCDEASAERCPVVPGQGQRLHWSFPDPSNLKGTAEQQLTTARKIRDDIKQRIQEWYGSGIRTS